MKTYVNCKDNKGNFVRMQVKIKISLQHNLANGIITKCAIDILKSHGYDVDENTKILVSIEK